MHLQMADFHKAFEAIDEDGSGEITVDELQHYMTKNNYKESFVSKWLTLFDEDKSGKITYKHYCETLGLVPRDRIVATKPPTVDREDEMIAPTVVGQQSAPVENNTNVHHPSPQAKPKKPQSCRVESKRKTSHSRAKPFSKHKRSLRASIKPGVILILLSGLHRGKKVIFLKQLGSGLLMVSGPFKLNGCPIRRVHQKMVIATTTQLDIGDVNLPGHLTDAYFSRKDSANVDRKTNADVSNIFAKTEKQYVLKEKRKEDQRAVDSQLISAIKQRADKSMLVRYLRAPFTLSSRDYPHKMQF